jgi:hypothetical protein
VANVKEDILEQIAEDYYTKRKGHFTKHNLKFRPSETDPNYVAKYDSVHSDIDLIVVNTGDRSKVIAVSCKSWQGGVNISNHKRSIERAIVEQPTKTTGERDDWCMFRELCINKWTDAFVSVLRNELNLDAKTRIKLEYVILCTKVTKQSVKDKEPFETSEILMDYFANRNIGLILSIMTIDPMIEQIIHAIRNKDTPSVENTHLSRTLQLIIASGHEIVKANRKNEV